MVDLLLLRKIRYGNENALAQIIDKYTPYVCTIIRNTVRYALTHEDIEEVASDVFLALWDNADKVNKLKPYIAATARNKAKNKLRKVSDSVSLEESVFADNGEMLDDALLANDEKQMVKSAVLAMDDTDRDIFLRYYYNSQTVSDIASETGKSEAAIKQRLVRGRKKIKQKIGSV